VCSTFTAKYVTHGDKYAPENPCFYCEDCYKVLHYSKDGKLEYDDFRVFPYYHE